MDAHLYGALQNSVIIFILLFLIVFFCFCFFFGGKLILRDPNCSPPSLCSKLVRCSQTFPRVSLAFVSVKGVALFAIKQSVAAGAFTSSKLPAEQWLSSQRHLPAAASLVTQCQLLGVSCGGVRPRVVLLVEGMGNNWGSKISTLSLVSVNERVRFN